MTAAPKLADSRQPWPSGLWSLAEVINNFLGTLVSVVSQLMLEQNIRSGGKEQLEAEDVAHVEGWLEVLMRVAADFELKIVPDRVALIRRQIGFGITQDQVSTEFRVLREILLAELKGQFIYRYPMTEAGVISTWKDDWAAALRSFPSAGKDILAAVDLWALQHSTASVFHLMRVLEHGIKALAGDLGKTFDVQNWQNILDEIESEIRAQAKGLPRGAAKSERLRFLSEAAKEFRFFKDGWRNYVSHNRAIYDQHQARSVMDHVRSFMNGLASQLSEE